MTRGENRKDLEQTRDQDRDSLFMQHENIEDMHFQNTSFDVDKRYVLDGYSYKWVRKEIRGTIDYNYERHLSTGWTVVPRDRVENNPNIDVLGRDELAQKYLCIQDLILMERPTRINVAEKNRYARDTINANKSLAGNVEDTPIISKVY